MTAPRSISRERLSRAAAEQLISVESVDICIIVPKEDEFKAHLAVFGVEEALEDLPQLRGDHYPFALLDVAEMSVVLVLMGDQGNTAAGICAREVLGTLAPLHIYLSGTSLGNQRRSQLGSVRVADRIQHASQWVAEEGERTPRWAHYSVPAHIRRDLGTFVSSDPTRKIKQIVVAQLQETLPDDWEHVYGKAQVNVEMSPILSDNELFREDGRRIWSYEERVASYDMESGGFAHALDGESGLNWAVIRGISDFGGDKRHAENGMRQVASIAAAAFLRTFLVEGLSKSHPRAMRPSQTPATRLSPDQHYNRYSATNFFIQRLRDDLAVHLPVNFVSRELTLDDLAAFCVSEGHDRAAVRTYLERLREEYFEDKYLNYTYEVDIRGYWEDYWYQEFREILASYGRESLSRSDVLDVGAGNGLELPILFQGAKSLTAADLSEAMLSAAASRYDGLQTVRASAERLDQIDTHSIDMYVSLRTYMSRFFDVAAALREAYRVLRPGGLLVLSVAAGYLDHVADEPTVIKGLKEVNGSEFVDVDRPIRVAGAYVRQLNALGFSQVFMTSKLTDVYIGALRPGGSVPFSPRLSAGPISA